LRCRGHVACEAPKTEQIEDAGWTAKRA
jgi:hypothetical protein